MDGDGDGGDVEVGESMQLWLLCLMVLWRNIWHEDYADRQTYRTGLSQEQVECAIPGSVIGASSALQEWTSVPS